MERKQKKKGSPHTNEVRPDVAGKTRIKAGVRKCARWLENVAAPLSMRFEDPSSHLLWRACVELFGKNCRIERIHDSIDIRRRFCSYQVTANIRLPCAVGPER